MRMDRIKSKFKFFLKIPKNDKTLESNLFYQKGN